MKCPDRMSADTVGRLTLAVLFVVLSAVLADISLSHPQFQMTAAFGMWVALALGIMQLIFFAKSRIRSLFESKNRPTGIWNSIRGHR